ncbi:MAG: hypothetical protein K9I94_04380 [Bacteroidales bacterium]|nr:hypothetical protein [Bacteroidales bacterium]
MIKLHLKVFISILVVMPVIFGSCKSTVKSTKEEKTSLITTNINGDGPKLEIEFTKGPEHNHPLMAVWVETLDGDYIQSLYVAKSIATGIFGHGKVEDGHWAPGEKRRPAALPYWAHKRGVKADDGLYVPTPENPVPDAYSGATPEGDFTLKTKADQNISPRFRVLLEINQSWDWNGYWTNDKYPENEHYKASSQPALVYSATINLEDDIKSYPMKLIGHSHYAGENGKLYTSLNTITTAKEIAQKIVVNEVSD